ncbi:hypothetical protein [Kitasatospora sp. NPDC057015]|uniref:hypothetical protein n=1 Tax=Kitasatospora sp. NPDC057015 TaxID=3346001 RepID=UPI003627ABBE
MEYDKAFENEVLASALGALAGAGRRGAEWMARLLPTHLHEAEIGLSLPFADAVSKAEVVLRGLGRPVGPMRPELQDGLRMFRVLTGGGSLNLNPVLVTAVLVAAPPGSRLHLRVAAKEGLVRQRAAERTGRQVESLLRTALD